VDGKEAQRRTGNRARVEFALTRPRPGVRRRRPISRAPRKLQAGPATTTIPKCIATDSGSKKPNRVANVSRT